MKITKLVEVAVAIKNIKKIHNLMLYSLFDLANENNRAGKYADSYKSKFQLESEVWEKIYALWIIDSLLEKNELTNKNSKAASFLLVNPLTTTNWDRHILRFFRSYNDSDNSLAYSRHLQKSSKVLDAMEVIKTLYENNMIGQMNEYLMKIKDFKDILKELIWYLCDFFIKQKKDATLLFNCPWEELEFKIIEEYLINNGNNELTTLFYIQRKDNKKALLAYKELINTKSKQDKYFVDFMKRYIKMILSKNNEESELCKHLNLHIPKPIELPIQISKEIVKIYNLPNNMEFDNITPIKEIIDKTPDTPSPTMFDGKSENYEENNDEEKQNAFKIIDNNILTMTINTHSRNKITSDPSITEQRSEIQCDEFKDQEKLEDVDVPPFETGELDQNVETGELDQNIDENKSNNIKNIEVIPEEPGAESDKMESEDSVQERIEKFASFNLELNSPL